MVKALGCLNDIRKPWRTGIYLAMIMLFAWPLIVHAIPGTRVSTTNNEELPRIVETYPKNGDIDVPVDAVIVVKFSKPMNASTITNENFYAYNPEDGDLFKADIVYDNSTFEARYIPTGEVTLIAMGGEYKEEEHHEEHHEEEEGEGWHYGATIRVVLRSEIKDIYGNPLDGDGDGIPNDYIFEFTVEHYKQRDTTDGMFIPFTEPAIIAMVIAILTLIIYHKKA